MADAIFAFADSLTTRHSLTSRGPSFWALVRRSLDRPVFEALSSSAIPVVPELAMFVPSKLGSTTPQRQYTDRKSPCSRPQREFTLEDFCFDDSDQAISETSFVSADSTPPGHSLTSRRSSPSKPDSTTLQRQYDASDGHYSPPVAGKMPGSKDQIENLYLWQIFLRHAARLYIARREDAYTPEDQHALATLDTLRKVVSALGMSTPVTATTRERNNQPVRGRAVNYSPSLMLHCELCWRSSMRCAVQKWFPNRVSTNDYSPRFCIYHVPLENPPPSNRYRTDIRYRHIFQKEIILRNQELRGNRPLSLIAPVPATVAEWRKAAYDIVHCAMQPPKRNAQSSTGCTLSNVFKHQQQGHSQKEIADVLCVSKQAVSAAVSRLHEIKAFHESEAGIDFITEEPFALDQEATWYLFGEVRRLRASGQSTTQISRAVGRFKYTIQAIERWISVVDQLRQRPHSDSRKEAVRCFVAPAAVKLIRKRLRQPEQPPWLVH